MHETLKPYLINAFYSWCMDIGYTPLISVIKWNENILPDHLSHENDITFNIHPKAVRNLIFSKDTIEFEAMFDGQAFQITIHHKSLSSIHTSEGEHGLNFDINEIIEEQEESLKKKPQLVVIKNEIDNITK